MLALRRLLILLCLSALLGMPMLGPVPAMAGGVRSQSKTTVKAAMVYNIIRFTRFPKTPSRIHLCVLANDPVAQKLRALENRAVGSARIDVMLLSSTNNMGAGCEVIYLDSAAPDTIGARARGQLLIGAGPNFADRGGTIGLIQYGRQVRFVVNADAAQQAGIGFPAQLLQMAAKVIS